MKTAPTAAVVGGGVIGLAVAWRAAEAGWQVTVHDPVADGAVPSSAAAWVAGGMLTPITEGAAAAEVAAYPLGAASLSRWPAFAVDLERTSGMPSGLRPEGTLAVALTDDDLDELRIFSGPSHRPRPSQQPSRCGAMPVAEPC